MVKLIQAKYIKQLFIFLVFALLFSYQKNATADIDRSLTAAIRIMGNNDVPVSLSVNEMRSGELNNRHLGLLSYAVAGEDSYLMNNFIESQNAFTSVLREDSVELIDAAATVMVVDTLSLLVSLIDELIVLGDTTSMDYQREDLVGSEAYNPILVQAVGLGQIAAYSELFEGYRGFLRGALNLTFSLRGFGEASPRNAMRELSEAFPSKRDYLSHRTFLQTSECSSLFCSLYTLRIEEPNTPINLFVIRQMQVNEYYALFNSFGTAGTREERDFIRGGDLRNVDESLNSLRQSRAATETVLPGNDPNAGQQQQQQVPVISEECRMAPSLPGC